MDQNKKYANPSTTPFPKILLNFERTAKILDLGCGEGRTLKALKKQGFLNLEGIDSNEEAIKKSKKYLDVKNIDVLEFNTTKKYDIILAMGLFSLLQKNEQKRLIGKIESLLSKNGAVIFEDFGLNYTLKYIKRYLLNATITKEYGTFKYKGLVIHHFSKNETKELFKDFDLFMKQEKYISINGNYINGLTVIAWKKTLK